MQTESYVYLLANKHNNVLYTGATNHLIRRVYEHKNKLVAGFAQKYNVIDWFILKFVQILSSLLSAKNTSKNGHEKRIRL